MALAVVAVVAVWEWQDYKDRRDHAASVGVAQAEIDEGKEQWDRLTASAGCAAANLARGAQPATAVNSCLSVEEYDFAIFLTACTEALLERGRRPDAVSVDLAWFGCLTEAQVYEDSFGTDGY